MFILPYCSIFNSPPSSLNESLIKSVAAVNIPLIMSSSVPSRTEVPKDKDFINKGNLRIVGNLGTDISRDFAKELGIGDEAPNLVQMVCGVLGREQQR